VKNTERKEKEMNMEQLIVFLLIGGAAGWLAGQIMKGGGLGIIGNIVVGVIGAVLGGWIFGVLDISIGGKWVGPLVTATVGAVVLIFAIGLIRKN
jgi:uncharacterized membrane protein YeaQ/YmgE (transglycosylase-associated protein family)